jgi:undecaprenyl-diphosphatase
MIVAAILALSFIVVAASVEIAGSFPGDERALVELCNLFGTKIDDPLVWLGWATTSVVLAIVSVGVTAALTRGGRRSDAAHFAITVTVVLSLNPLLKLLFERSRPDVRPHPMGVSSYSFPSGHASATLGVVGALFIIARTLRGRRVVVIGGAVLVVAVAFSQIVTGVHSPSDILAGWLWVSAWLVAYWSARIAPRRAGLTR